MRAVRRVGTMRVPVPLEVVVGARDIRFGCAVASIAIGTFERLPFVFRDLFRGKKTACRRALPAVRAA